MCLSCFCDQNLFHHRESYLGWRYIWMGQNCIPFAGHAPKWMRLSWMGPDAIPITNVAFQAGNELASSQIPLADGIIITNDRAETRFSDPLARHRQLSRMFLRTGKRKIWLPLFSRVCSRAQSHFSKFRNNSKLLEHTLCGRQNVWLRAFVNNKTKKRLSLFESKINFFMSIIKRQTQRGDC